jgi:hypothetical protein
MGWNSGANSNQLYRPEASRLLTGAPADNLNPIEHLWWVHKKRMHKFYPEHNNYSKAEEEWDGFCNAIKKCWRRIPARLIVGRRTRVIDPASLPDLSPARP